MNDKELESQIDSLQEHVEELQQYVAVPGRPAGASAKTLAQMQAALEQLQAQRGASVASPEGDITAHERAEQDLELSHRVLEIANRHSRAKPLLEDFVAEVKSFTGCAAVGIRILDSDGRIPYEAYDGFSEEFYESESPLSIQRDECMCISIIRGEIDSKLPYCTKHGSFYMNGTTRFLATVSADEKGNTRNACNEMGYESVALIPIRAGDRIVGLIHIADPRDDAVPLETVKTLEHVAMQLGATIQRVRAEEAMRKTRDELEHRVQERTADLTTTVDELQGEVSERMEAENALAEANELLEKLFSNIELMVAYMDRDFNFIRVNRAYAEADNHTLDFFVGKNHFDLYPKEETEAIFRNVVDTGTPFFAYERSFRYIEHPERGTIYWDMSVQPVLEAGGEVVGLILCLIDVTERITARQEVEQQRQRLFSVLNVLPGYVYLVDSDYSIRFVNHTFLDLFGDVGGDPCYKVLRKNDRPCALCPILDVIKDQQPAVWEWICDDGRCFQTHAYPFSDVDGSQLVLKLGIDITERKILEKEVSEASIKERLRIGQDLHDSLGQMLTGVAFLSKMLQQKLSKKSAPEATDAAEIAHQASESVALTRVLAKGLFPVEFEAGGLMDALQEHAQDVERLFGISCVFRCSQSVLISDNVVATHVYHVAQEAINNAIRHGKARNIVVSLEKEDEIVTLAVRDDGKGLPDKSDRDHGIGMRIMNYRAGVIGGSFDVRTNLEGGTIVRCAFKTPTSTT